MFHTHTHTLTKEYSSEIYLHGKICDFLMFTVVTYNKVGFFDTYIYKNENLFKAYKKMSKTKKYTTIKTNISLLFT